MGMSIFSKTTGGLGRSVAARYVIDWKGLAIEASILYPDTLKKVVASFDTQLFDSVLSS